MSGNATQEGTGNLGIAVRKAIDIVASDPITLMTSDSSFTPLKDGDITISGRNVDIKSTRDVLIKRAKVAIN